MLLVKLGYRGISIERIGINYITQICPEFNSKSLKALVGRGYTFDFKIDSASSGRGYARYFGQNVMFFCARSGISQASDCIYWTF